jgi:hypothetical protein
MTALCSHIVAPVDWVRTRRRLWNPHIHTFDQRRGIDRSGTDFYRFGCHREKHMMGELALIGASAADFHPAAFTTGYGVPSASVTAVWRSFHPITKAPGAVPY